MLPDPAVSGFSVFLLGLSLGLTACAVTCLPFIGTFALGKAEGRSSGMRDTAYFLGGRLISYTLLGALAGALGAWFVRELAAGAGNLVIGLSSLFAAAWLIWPTPTHRGCRPARRFAKLSPMLLGIGLTLIPCAPLATLLAAAAAGGSSFQGAYYGLLFGMGTLLTPMLVLIPSVASIGQALRTDRAWLLPWMRAGASLVLVLLAYTRCELFAAGLGKYVLAITVLIVFWRYYRAHHEGAGQKRVFTLRQIE
jgi:thiol:disulfide interchange protein DsbD